MVVRFTAIVAPPIIRPDELASSMESALDLFIASFQREMAYYPPWRPWRHPPPKTGPRKGGKRTGAYGRNWAAARIQRRPFERTITNVTPYANYVGGPGQAWFMAERGWPRAKDISKKLAASFRLDLRTSVRR